MAPNNPSLFNSTPFQIYRPQGQSSANLTLHDKLKILNHCHSDEATGLMQQEKIVQLRQMGYYTHSQSTLSSLLKVEDLLHAHADTHPKHLHVKRHPIVQLPQVEEALHEWILQKQDRSIRLTGNIIREKARDFCQHFNIPESKILKFSNGWLDCLKK
ncbi:hypothetical protein FRC11_001715 [Ceratobasidium sp. 423]|nr:hypothetical protein FRC11_001715 [Ceratobasidium sp. 423]